ncbi:hypothetical protein CsSME_00015146 [Camellia sinensis var. sinensis]
MADRLSLVPIGHQSSVIINLAIFLWLCNIYSDPPSEGNCVISVCECVYFRGVSSCIYLVVILKFHLFEFQDVLGREVHSSGSSCARAKIAHSQYFGALQNFCRHVFHARAGFFALERWRSSGYSGARAGSTFWCKFWEGEIYARADWFSRSSGCTLFLCIGTRAGLIALERT